MAEESIGRKDFLEKNAQARSFAKLNIALNQQNQVTPGSIMLTPDSLKDKEVVIIGSGVGGLTTAYELLAQKSGAKITVLEARDRTGGRCMTLRTGDTLVEDESSALNDNRPGETQVVRFDRPVGDSEPYLNAGPGRIPSSHKRLLNYLKKFGVAVEIYVMASGSNLSQMKEGPFNGKPIVNRRLDNNSRGWIAAMVFQNAETLLESTEPFCSQALNRHEKDDLIRKLQDFMTTFGELNSNGQYAVSADVDGQDEGGATRAGYTVLPGVDAGEVAKAIDLETLLKSEFWSKSRLYQPIDFLWQPTMFQPVGGMDRVQHAFVQQIAALGGEIHLNSPVTKIDWNSETRKFCITVAKANVPDLEYKADYCFNNMAIPFLKAILSKKLQDITSNQGFSETFKASLHAVYNAQFPKDASKKLFLAKTTKVGWQANRNLWQGAPIEARSVLSLKTSNLNKCYQVLSVHDSELGVVPIYGGISWTDDPITQIWYPSEAYHDVKGILTGCYNFGQNAFESGEKTVAERLKQARDGALLFGKGFGEGLERGVAIAWQKVPYIKGGWAQWNTVGENEEESVNFYNNLIQGTGIDGVSEPCFFIVGDQLSSLPGWQEGAIASALNAISRLSRPDYLLPFVESLPDTRVMVEGI